jgi:hypothetical protein
LQKKSWWHVMFSPTNQISPFVAWTTGCSQSEHSCCGMCCLHQPIKSHHSSHEPQAVANQNTAVVACVVSTNQSNLTDHHMIHPCSQPEATSLEHTRLSVSLNILFRFNLPIRNWGKIMWGASTYNLILPSYPLGRNNTFSQRFNHQFLIDKL